MILSGIIFFPILIGALLLIIPLKGRWLKGVAFISSMIALLLSLSLFYLYDPSTHALQLVEKKEWIPSWGISYFLGVDGISFWLILLTTFLIPFVILGCWNSIQERLRSFFVSLFFLEGCLLGSFLAFDAVLFYIFFEAALLPMYFIVGIWGGPQRIYAAIKFFIYTMAGSLFMLLGIIFLMFLSYKNLGYLSASLLDFYKLDIPFVGGFLKSTQTLLLIAFSLAFGIKVPIFPFHTWLPDAHVEAPTAGSVILAAVMLKMGTYGFLRFVLPLFHEAALYWSWVFLFLGVVGIIYGALVAFVQEDIKKLIAYSSVSHMGYVIIGTFSLTLLGITGGLFQMLSHGISTGALFLLVGMIYEKTHDRKIANYGGLGSKAPIFTVFFLLVTFSSIAVPLTNGFVGEFYILLGTFINHKMFAFFGGLGVILGAIYMLSMIKRVFFGPEKGVVLSHKTLDISLREKISLVPFVVLIFWMGIFPGHFLSWSESSLHHLQKNLNKYELTVYKEIKK